MKKLNLLMLMLIALFFNACSVKNPFSNPFVDTNTSINKTNYKDKMKYLKQKYLETNEIKKGHAQMLKEDADYMKKNVGHSLIENKAPDFISQKPVFTEPIFAKVEFMPYETKDGIWHEQQSVWIKVESGEIALKSNPFDNQTVVDQYKSILEK